MNKKVYIKLGPIGQLYCQAYSLCGWPQALRRQRRWPIRHGCPGVHSLMFSENVFWTEMVTLYIGKTIYALRKTTCSNRKFGIIDFNKWLILYLFNMAFYIVNTRYYMLKCNIISHALNTNLQIPTKNFPENRPRKC